MCMAALCFAGWILCCPCWMLGFSLRDPPDYYYYNYDYYSRHHSQQHQHQQQMSDNDDELTSDPCWPCDNCVTRQSPVTSVPSQHREERTMLKWRSCCNRNAKHLHPSDSSSSRKHAVSYCKSLKDALIGLPSSKVPPTHDGKCSWS